MARNKKDVVPHYELLYIVENKYTEDDLKGINSRVNKLLEDNGGKITLEEAWGKKKFCYPIKHGRHGYYSFVEFDMDANAVAKVNTELRMSHEVLRYMIVNRPAKTAEQIAEEKVRLEKRVAKAAKKFEGKPAPKKEEAKTSKKKVDSKELDDKLNKILETDDLL